MLYPPCAAAELHMRLFVNFTLDEIQEMVNKANSGEIDPIYVDYVEVVYVITHVCRTKSVVDPGEGAEGPSPPPCDNKS